MNSDERPVNYTRQGDIINMRAQHGGVAVGKVVGGPDDLREAVSALKDLLEHLKENGAVDEDGEVVDEDAVRAETARRGGRFRALLGPITRATGQRMLESVHDQAAATVVDTLVHLPG
ncbi:hypothetical protein [Actinomadura madurae]|uniref:hypothetical protein n=1 Tax=Actinomadura madurae TaxID=1993 RepID=UPI0020D257EF|nr:hypothetical protein [Actinomadura madurae]MCP9948049.1 hypothetical protein [Actinomadura madurae]MCP9964820.1 hypothetical protein [Actinomadura madurae]MCP9977305.1 hypothetical protein [Actinomadura madurae]MCQ0011189.1 hypothetical protein [Actinomadura madurae]MCQ0013489.1 hypothetical protein [Actinomadura madurae]